MSRKIILLGAPLASTLKWDEDELLQVQQLPELADHNVPGQTLTPSRPPAAWRKLRTPVEQLEPSFLNPTTELEHSFPVDAGFFRTTDLYPSVGSQGLLTQESSDIPATIESSEDVLSEFYNHSFAIHEEGPSSQVEAMTEPASVHEAVSPPWSSSDMANPEPPRPGHLSDLEDIPDAAYLRSIQPQTMTVNLIVGILSLPTPRTVITGRRWGREQKSELIEILVGDETKAGFGITVWLSETLDRNGMRSQIQHLQPKDIVLFRNVALSSFRDKVHGQSLRRGLTKVDLLYGRQIDREAGRRGVYSARAVRNQLQTDVADPQLMKVRRVRDWMENFIDSTSDRHEGNDTRPRSQFGGQLHDARKRPLPPDDSP